MKKLISALKNKGVLSSSLLEEALLRVDRLDFVTSQWIDYAYEDVALPTMEGQTISQPYTVAFMLEKLSVCPGETVLDIGAGSGWQTALLAYLVGEKGKVYAYEINPSLFNFAQKNVSRYEDLFSRVEWVPYSGEKSLGVSFNRLIAAASLQKEPPLFWREDLLSRGRLIYPYKNSLVLEKKDSQGEMFKEFFPGFSFVPFR